MAGCASPAFNWSMKRSLIAAKAMAVDVERGDLGAQQRIVDRPDRRAQRRPLAAEPHAADHLALVAEQIFGDVPAAC